MKCKIYFIQCLETGEVYIGSTKQRLLCQRIAGHKYQRDCGSTQILDRDNYICDILEEVEESQRYIREQYYIDTTDNCVNKQRAPSGLSRKEYIKQYNQLNKDKLKEYKKQYHELNKEQSKQRYIQNRDKLSQKYTCECGEVLCVASKSRHEKRKKHQEYLKNNCCKAI